MSQQQPHSLNVELVEDPKGDWMSNSRSTLLVVVILIATLSFQVGINPPGGFWQDDQEGHIAGTPIPSPLGSVDVGPPESSWQVDQVGHRAGAPILMDKHPKRFRCMAVSSWLCFYSSMVLIFVLLTGTSIKSKLFKSIFVFCMSTLVFLFQVSQTGLPSAIVVAVIVLLGGLVLILQK